MSCSICSKKSSGHQCILCQRNECFSNRGPNNSLLFRCESCYKHAKCSSCKMRFVHLSNKENLCALCYGKRDNYTNNNNKSGCSFCNNPPPVNNQFSYNTRY